MKLLSSTLSCASLLVAMLAAPAMAGGKDAKVGNLVIGAPWTRATPGGAKVGVGYLSIVNVGKNVDRLKTANSPIAARVEIHTMSMDGGIMRMRHLKDGLELAPQSVTELRPGGFHLMLIGLKKPIKKGDILPLRLEFATAGAVDLTMTAAGIGATASPHGSVSATGGSKSGETGGSKSGQHQPAPTGSTHGKTATPK